jgi:hypothetical protein
MAFNATKIAMRYAVLTHPTKKKSLEVIGDRKGKMRQRSEYLF